MNDILFGNNNQTMMKKMAHKSFAANKKRNMVTVIAIILTTSMRITHCGHSHLFPLVIICPSEKNPICLMGLIIFRCSNLIFRSRPSGSPSGSRITAATIIWVMQSVIFRKSTGKDRLPQRIIPAVRHRCYCHPNLHPYFRMFDSHVS